MPLNSKTMIPSAGFKTIQGHHIAIIWQRFLPYHIARIKYLKNRLKPLGYRVTAIEVSSQDVSYGFPSNTQELEHICCFPKATYQTHKAKNIYKKVLGVLNNLKPDVVFAPATPFPEGMAAIAYRRINRKRVVIMDDAWEYSDRRGFLTRLIKRLIHRNVDAAFIPARSHISYYKKLGFTEDRIIYGVDVVDNEYFSNMSHRIISKSSSLRLSKNLPQKYFLFVGRFLPRKGLETLIEAYNKYCTRLEEKAWKLVLVGNGPDFDRIYKLSQSVSKIIFAGPQYGNELCIFYGLGSAVIVPSISDSWGLVVNEAMASGLPVLVSTGCGAAKTLVKDGENGWKFPPGDSDYLSELMVRLGEFSQEKLKKMGNQSRKIIDDWSLDRFVDGAFQAISLPRGVPAGILSDLMTLLWKGRVSTN